MKVCLIAGARPNFMKIGPVMAGLRDHAVEPVLVHTGQHYDDAMSAVFFDELRLPRPAHDLGVGPGSPVSQLAAIMLALEPVLLAGRFDVVVVVGDVTSTLAGALVAARCGIDVAHVEAGLRSFDDTMPEELNRVVVDRVSRVLYAPSTDAVANLADEGIGGRRVVMVGNVMVDTLLDNLERARARGIAASLGFEPGGYVLATLHRPSNVDQPARLAGLLRALGEIAVRRPVVFPLHPRTRRRLEVSGVSVPPGVHLVEPLGYLDFLGLEADAALVITDSGGVQEETTVLGVPCLTVRPNTERPITVSEGTNELVGTDPDRVIRRALARIDERRGAKRPPLWDGKAGRRIADDLVTRYG